MLATSIDSADINSICQILNRKRTIITDNEVAQKAGITKEELGATPDVKIE